MIRCPPPVSAEANSVKVVAAAADCADAASSAIVGNSESDCLCDPPSEVGIGQRTQALIERGEGGGEISAGEASQGTAAGRQQPTGNLEVLGLRDHGGLCVALRGTQGAEAEGNEQMAKLHANLWLATAEMACEESGERRKDSDGVRRTAHGPLQGNSCAERPRPGVSVERRSDRSMKKT